ncbi:type IV secretory system conjugative DNA transfer family protein [Amycolatopsis sp. NPDC049868]|uniref:type IV secretory system conjugative DNA transfer family protein n=1 Tax=Amycolatopsis sp. NPDC049868 TaxID=3363934 RepID=UPI003796AF28
MSSAQSVAAYTEVFTSPLQDYLRDPGGAMHALLTTVRVVAVSWGPVAGPSLALAWTGAILGRRWWMRRRHDRMAAGARLVTVLAPPTVDPGGAEALFSNLVGLLRPGWKRRIHGQPHIVWEYVFSQAGVAVRVWLPGIVPPGMAERAIEAAWPGAHTRTTPAKPPIPESAPAGKAVEAVGGEMRLARSEALPIRCDFPADPVRALLGAPVGLAAHERAVVQILARPVTGSRFRKARRAARHVRTGSSTKLAGRLLDLITPHAGGSKPRTSATKPVTDRQTVLENSAQDRVIVAKQRGSQYETRVRYAVATLVDEHTTRPERAPVREHLRGRGHAIASAFAAYSEHNYYRRVRLPHPIQALAERRLTSGDLLSIAELAALAHVPTDEAVPGLQRAGAKAVPPPPGIATEGPGVKSIGITDSGHSRPVGLRVADARHHVHILGATGSGKSELMARMILDDADAGRGLVVIDPKGDLVADTLMRLPSRLGTKVVLFDADSRSRPPVLNPLEGDDTARTVDNLVSIFSRVYASSWGPRTEDILRSGLLTLRELPGTPTLTDLPKLLTVPAFRHRALEQISDDVLTGFWTWYDDLSDASRAQVVAPLMNKLRGLLLRPFVRASLAGGGSTVDMDEVLDGSICLVRLSKDALGMDSARLIGSIIVARTWQAATRRARIPQRDRRDASLYIDECHNFLNLAYPMEDMLAEARGYRMSMTLAHQYLRQLPPELEEGISTNARSKIIFSASPEDARHLARHTAPRLSEHDLTNLGRFHIAARLVLDSEEVPPFTAVTEKLPPAIPGRSKEIRRLARVNTEPRSMPSPVEIVRPAALDPRRAA